MEPGNIFNINSDMITSVDLCRQEKIDKDNKSIPSYHFIYASQLYGTLFGIYGWFELEKLNQKQYVVTKVDLSILNYQGIINIGFTDDVPYVEIIEEEFKVFFGVRAMSKRKTQTVNFKGLVLENGDRERVTFCRILYRMEDFDNSPGGEDVCNPLNKPVPDTDFFDNEFHGRSGVDYFNNPLRPGMAGYENITIDNLRSPEVAMKNKEKLVIASPRCTQSVVNLFYSE